MRLGVHGIVEVAGVLAIDRDQRQLAQIDPLLRLARIHLLAEACASRSAAVGNSCGRSKRAIADSVASSTGRSGSRRFTMAACAAEAALA